jgi:hypothetical protein
MFIEGKRLIPLNDHLKKREFGDIPPSSIMILFSYTMQIINDRTEHFPPVNRFLSGNKRSLITIAEIPKEEYVLKCTSACAGCIDSLALRYVLKAAGPAV